MNERNFNAIAIYLFLFVDVFINAHGYATNNYPIDFVFKNTYVFVGRIYFYKVSINKLEFKKRADCF